MADFKVPIVKVDAIEPIEGADRIVAAVIGGYQCVVMKDQFQPGDLAVYIPEGSIVPEDILAELGLTGKLSGSQKNRVKAIKLKKCLSQGLLYPMDNLIARAEQYAVEQDIDIVFARSVAENPLEGTDVSELLGITKYEPPIPGQFSGQLARPRGDYELLKFDVENIKAWPKVFQDGDPVEITEKIHGTFMEVAYWPESAQCAVSSKGLAGRGFIIEDCEANDHNVYVRIKRQHNLDREMPALHRILVQNHFVQETDPIFVLGEVFGQGIQDLTYKTVLGFRVFDIYVGKPGQGQYLPTHSREGLCSVVGLESVPVLYSGPFSQDVLVQHTSGIEAVSGVGANVREGVVIRLTQEREPIRGLGRIILKSVSEAYLLRKGEVTEYV